MTDNTLGGALNSIKEFLEKVISNPKELLELIEAEIKEKPETGGLYGNIISAGHREWTSTYGRPWNLP